jgi:hypothetical protein
VQVERFAAPILAFIPEGRRRKREGREGGREGGKEGGKEGGRKSKVEAEGR